MRIISGTARGAKLISLEGLETRPTGERVKEGLFSALHFELIGAKVLELFAGSGQLGLEALSRGATVCTFVDSNRSACEVIRANAAKTGFENASHVINSDCEQFLLRNRDIYDIIILDPPYRKGLADQLLPLVERAVAPGGLVSVETERKYVPQEEYAGLKLKKSYNYGNTSVHLYRKEDSQ